MTDKQDRDLGRLAHLIQSCDEEDTGEIVRLFGASEAGLATEDHYTDPQSRPSKGFMSLWAARFWKRKPRSS